MFSNLVEQIIFLTCSSSMLMMEAKKAARLSLLKTMLEITLGKFHVNLIINFRQSILWLKTQLENMLLDVSQFFQLLKLQQVKKKATKPFSSRQATQQKLIMRLTLILWEQTLTKMPWVNIMANLSLEKSKQITLVGRIMFMPFHQTNILIYYLLMIMDRFRDFLDKLLGEMSQLKQD